MRSYQSRLLPGDLYRWTVTNILWALLGALKMCGTVLLMAALAYGAAYLANWHEALMLWGHMFAFLGVVILTFGTVYQIFNGERW